MPEQRGTQGISNRQDAKELRSTVSMNRLDTKSEVFEGTEYKDIWLRVHSGKGSTSIMVQIDGKKQSAENIGNQVLEMFRFFLESPVFDNKG